uniref:Echinoderm microtubule-associated protein-like 1 n=1 Tax=Neogobius melanostomus TaxID=47308 RepID=A0A8C6T4K5_9GOBI
MLLNKGVGLVTDSSSALSLCHSVIVDDRSSAASGLDVADRLTYLEQRMQMQEDEIQLLKMALADVLKRLNITEEYQANAAAVAGRRAGGKARPVSLALSSRPAMKKSSTTPSTGPGRTYSPTPSSRSDVRSPPGSVKDSPKARPGSAASTRKPQEGRVTHCKVTMQIYLSPLAKKTGHSEAAKSSATVTTRGKPTNNATATPNRPGAKTGTGGAKGERKKEKFTLNLQKTSSGSSQSALQETSSYHSPVKSPSQYFQICY